MKKNIFIITTFFYLFLLLGILHGAIPASERAALIALYRSTNGDSWNNNNGWKTAPLSADGFAMPGTEGSWYGVTVELNHVTCLNLYENQLIGNIPSELGKLSKLRVLSLFANQLSGSIPSELGKLSNLSRLYLASNQLIGSIPSELGNLSNLTALSLDSNQLSGEIPSSLTNLTKIFSPYLNIGYNCLWATDPATLFWLNSIDPDWKDHQDQCGGKNPTME